MRGVVGKAGGSQLPTEPTNPLFVAIRTATPSSTSRP
jgi:hypothetical protein